MKNQRTFWEHMKHHSKPFKKLGRGIVTTSLVAGALLAPWSAAHAQEVSADFNNDGDMVFAMATPYGKAPGLNHSTYRSTATEAGAVQIMYGMSMYGLQTNAYAPRLLPQRNLNFVNEYKSEIAVDEREFLVVFSW